MHGEHIPMVHVTRLRQPPMLQCQRRNDGIGLCIAQLSDKFFGKMTPVTVASSCGSQI